LELNEHFWKALDEAPDTANDYFEAYEEMIDAVDEHDFSAYNNSGFIDLTVEKMSRWLEALSALDTGDSTA
jgi:hypothetical protein